MGSYATDVVCFFGAKTRPNVSMSKVLFPEPETPQIPTKTFNGIIMSSPFKLFSRAPRMIIHFSGFLLGLACTVYLCNHFPVTVLLFFMSSNVPSAVTCPPLAPAPGPMSIMWSAAAIMTGSCSTTMTVFPSSRSSFKTCTNASTSDGCNPREGSSNKMVNDVKLLPNIPASFTRSASPADKVADTLFKCT